MPLPATTNRLPSSVNSYNTACKRTSSQGWGEVLFVLQKLTACKTGGPAVFIVGPGFHAQLFGFVNAGIYAVEPFVGEVFGFQTAAGVHEEAVHSAFLHVSDLVSQFAFFQLVVPAPEGDTSVRGGFFSDCFDCLFHIADSFIQSLS